MRYHQGGKQEFAAVLFMLTKSIRAENPFVTYGAFDADEYGADVAARLNDILAGLVDDFGETRRGMEDDDKAVEIAGMVRDEFRKGTPVDDIFRHLWRELDVRRVD